MKRVIKAISACVLALAALTSCINDTGCRCQTPDCGSCDNKDSGTNWQILNFNVKASNWEPCKDSNGINPFFRASLDVPELTSEILEKGMMQAYVYVGENNQQLLPYVRHYESYDKDQEGNDVQYMWTQTIDIEYGVGGAWIYVTNSDFYTEETPGDMFFRIVLLW